MLGFIASVDKLSAWIGKAFAWLILLMTLAVSYEVFVRYVMGRPTPWAFDITYMMYGTLFMMGGAYTLSRDGHVRGDFVYRLWRPQTQARVELVLYFLFFFPGVLALIFAGWRYAERAWRYYEVSVFSPAGIPIFHFKSVIVAAGILLFIQGIAQVCRCIVCIRTGSWPRQSEDVEEMEKILLAEGQEALSGSSTAAAELRGGQPEKDDNKIISQRGDRNV
ncbi:TRAP transporter small permease subunit [Lutibaculum baratangense]|uniref:TRAP transporter small permease protein n=1 Tax=Lutibaculum baratangense AMV1 TaxID=631454 RepID=V4RU34_9HYPH|nr:TRAP transporter small permease subunit [Lutibaculum baratangense]ESR26605.1 TRAP-type transport system, small permease component, predicted N-acetylneuraminate transporter [Lutibaculum baratangense AMV1]